MQKYLGTFTTFQNILQFDELQLNLILYWYNLDKNFVQLLSKNSISQSNQIDC